MKTFILAIALLCVTSITVSAQWHFIGQNIYYPYGDVTVKKDLTVEGDLFASGLSGENSYYLKGGDAAFELYLQSDASSSSASLYFGQVDSSARFSIVGEYDRQFTWRKDEMTFKYLPTNEIFFHYYATDDKIVISEDVDSVGIRGNLDVDGRATAFELNLADIPTDSTGLATGDIYRVVNQLYWKY